ncbi:GNAT family N-acetyltransferase [Phreatobacter stygius]|uniref:N-acetyltransferase n=1 Tax=Phreatobacter stygius TaxID=1940610 RepID=A0A4D7B9N3_9HYPH|nr:GNAT family N-acetyltransferase [Phreatobacter stygius]QCI67483.1 N-acetyltransferase [Phreatobacter stygius]
MSSAIHDNIDDRRFELTVDGRIVFADYRREPSSIVIFHVEAPVPLRGTGAAGRLMEGIVELARAENRELVPLCSYASAWMRRHKQEVGVSG